MRDDEPRRNNGRSTLTIQSCALVAPVCVYYCRTYDRKFCSECGAESAPAGQRLPAAGGDLAWAARTGSGPMWMCGDIFAASRLWRGRLLTTGRLSCRHPVVV